MTESKKAKKRRSGIVPAAVFAIVVAAVVPNLTGCGDGSSNGVADLGFLGVANIGFDLAAHGVADFAFRD